MEGLYFSELSGTVYFGNGVPLKENPGVSVIKGERIDVTQSFYSVLLQKFPPGGSYLITDDKKKPCYKITIEATHD